MVLRLSMILPGTHRQTKSQREYIKYQETLYTQIIYRKNMQMTLTHGWESQWQQTLYVPQEKNFFPGKLVFGQEMILQINDLTDWRYTCHRKQAQIEKGVIIEKTTRIDYYYIVRYQLMIKHKSEYKYKTLFKGPYGIVQT